ncbi:MAG: hypothetical protein K2X93_01165 [Candidatus Obscuribacterales bacterium]|nr:hypothetical protein [Candidatus Obscuribacterales bacterium]
MKNALTEYMKSKRAGVGVLKKSETVVVGFVDEHLNMIHEKKKVRKSK